MLMTLLFVLCAGRAQHLPRLGLCGLRQQGDRSLVQARGALQLGQLPEGLDLRVEPQPRLQQPTGVM